MDNVTFLKQSITKPGQLALAAPNLRKRTVSIFKDTCFDFPELYLDVYIEGPDHDKAGFPEMFVRTASKLVKNPEDADLVIFTGGSDVDPALYNEKPHRTTHANRKRDDDCMKLYLMCLEKGIPMFGVCRGAQFLHVMNGGKLYQDVDGHHGDHAMFATRDRVLIPNVSSVHHQMCQSNVVGGMEILGTASRSTERWYTPTNREMGQNLDVEAYFYRDSCCFGVQGHPEYRNYGQFTKWCLDKINELVICNPDTEFVARNRRIKPDLVAQRASGWGGKLPIPSAPEPEGVEPETETQETMQETC